MSSGKEYIPCFTSDSGSESEFESPAISQVKTNALAFNGTPSSYLDIQMEAPVDLAMP